MFIQNVVLQVAAVITCLLGSVFGETRRPNIILVLADDLGWNDVSFHGSNQIPTPNIDALAYNGIILNSHYVPALCTPSRASLLTGKYPTSTGMQHLVILSAEPWGLPLEETLMPQYFKRQGYATHAIGKWHLGFYKKEYTPTYRGFDTHFGYWNGFHDYFDHTMQAGPLKGYDMRRGLDVDYSSEGLYSTDLFTQEAVSIIENHNQTEGPLFLYMSHLAPHTGNSHNPFQAPEEEILKHGHISHPERRVYAAMVTKLDESLGKIVSALKSADMLDNSIILFMADNGAVTYGIHSNRGSNWPLRGLKESPWEGGIRGVAALWSPLLQRNSQRVSDQMMHMSDWLPTLYSAAGFNVSDLGVIDGMDMWQTLVDNKESPRTEVFHNYDEIEDYSSLRMGSWKFVEGSAQFGEFDEWYGESGRDDNLSYDIDGVLNSDVNKALSEYLREKATENWVPISKESVQVARQNSLVTCEYPTFSEYFLISGNHTKAAGQVEDESVVASATKFDSVEDAIKAKGKIMAELEGIYRRHPFAGDDARNFRFTREDEKRISNLIESGRLRKSFKCDPIGAECLFNLMADPCERVNLADVFPGILTEMKKRLAELKKSVVKPLNQAADPFSNPDFHNGTWANWRDSKRYASSDLFANLKDLLSAASGFDRQVLSLAIDKVLLSDWVLMIQESSVFLAGIKLCLWCLAAGAMLVLMNLIRKMNPFTRDSRKKSV